MHQNYYNCCVCKWHVLFEILIGDGYLSGTSNGVLFYKVLVWDYDEWFIIKHILLPP